MISIGEEDEARRDVGAGAGGGGWAIGGVSSSGDPQVRNSPFAKSVEGKSRTIYPSTWQPDTQTFPSGTLQFSLRARNKDLRLKLVTC